MYFTEKSTKQIIKYCNFCKKHCLSCNSGTAMLQKCNIALCFCVCMFCFCSSKTPGSETLQTLEYVYDNFVNNFDILCYSLSELCRPGLPSSPSASVYLSLSTCVLYIRHGCANLTFVISITDKAFLYMGVL